MDVNEVISVLRSARGGMVQHLQQYEFVHHACVEYGTSTPHITSHHSPRHGMVVKIKGAPYVFVKADDPTRNAKESKIQEEEAEDEPDEPGLAIPP